MERLRTENVPGESGRLRELFDYLAERGAEAAPVSQAEIADEVFGQTAVDGDDATVRVYIHRLRKRLDEYYAGQDNAAVRLTVPAGAYVLRLIGPDGQESVPPLRRFRRPPRLWLVLAGGLLILAGAFLAGRLLTPRAPGANAIWAPFVQSDRPILIVVGDYYIYGEIDPVRPEEGRLIRDFRVNSPTDLLSMQEAAPLRYGNAEDVGLSYLPVSSAYAMSALMPVLARHPEPVRVMPASELTVEATQRYNIVYIGLLSGMRLLQDVTFSGSTFAIGESYDELIDGRGDRRYVSEEARNLPSPAYYRDYGYVASFHAPGGALVAVVAAARDTGLRGIAPLVAREDLADRLAQVVDSPTGFEAVYQITGQQGADLSERLLQARERPGSSNLAEPAR